MSSHEPPYMRNDSMNTSIRGNLRLLALFLGAFTGLVTLQADSKKSGSCHMTKELSELESEFESCFNDIEAELNVVAELIDTDSPCGNVIPIFQVPVVISQSGKYCVTADLVYPGTGAAITVLADNVTINFHNHDLTLTDGTSTGILVQGVHEFVLENDIIQAVSVCKSPTSVAVHLLDVTKATINNIFTKFTTKGIWIDNSTDVLVEHSHLDSHEGTVQFVFPSPATMAGTGNGAGIWVNNSSGVTIDYCTFVGPDCPFDAGLTTFGLHVEADSTNVILTNSTFGFTQLVLIHALNVNGMLIDHCVAVASPSSSLNVVQRAAALQVKMQTMLLSEIQISYIQVTSLASMESF